MNGSDDFEHVFSLSSSRSGLDVVNEDQGCVYENKTFKVLTLFLNKVRKFENVLWGNSTLWFTGYHWEWGNLWVDRTGVWGSVGWSLIFCEVGTCVACLIEPVSSVVKASANVFPRCASCAVAKSGCQLSIDVMRTGLVETGAMLYEVLATGSRDCHASNGLQCVLSYGGLLIVECLQRSRLRSCRDMSIYDQSVCR